MHSLTHFARQCLPVAISFNLWNTCSKFRSVRTPALHFPLLTSFYSSHPMQKSLDKKLVATVLRPFYFLVHPDRFHGDTACQIVNEDSMKDLGEAVQMLLAGRPSRQKTCTFYIRGKEEGAGYQKVSVDLGSNSLQDLIRRVLMASGLPSHSGGSTSSAGEDVAASLSSWIAMGQGGMPINYADHLPTYIPPREPNFHEWILKNAESSGKYLERARRVERDIRLLCDHLYERHGIVDLKWSHEWNLAAFRSVLRSLSNLLDCHPVQATLLRGRRVIFTKCNGISQAGDILLGVKNVQDQWMDLLKMLPSLFRLSEKAVLAEEKLSASLGGAKIKSDPLQPLSVELVSRLLGLSNTLDTLRGFQKRRLGANMLETAALSDITISIGGSSPLEKLAVREDGSVVVPTSCSPTHIIPYLLTHASIARSKERLHRRQLELIKSLGPECRRAFDLDDLTLEATLSTQQCLTGLTSLREIASDEDMSNTKRLLRGLRLHMSKYYSIPETGEICFPWNFKAS